MKIKIEDCSTVLELRKDTATLKQLADLEELVNVPVTRGGAYFSDWEKQFIRSVRQQFDDTLEFTEKQRDKIKEVWHAVDLLRRREPTWFSLPDPISPGCAQTRWVYR